MNVYALITTLILTLYAVYSFNSGQTPPMAIGVVCVIGATISGLYLVASATAQKTIGD